MADLAADSHPTAGSCWTASMVANTNNCRLLQSLRDAQSHSRASSFGNLAHVSPPRRALSVASVNELSLPAGDMFLWLCATAVFMYDIFARLQLNVIMNNLVDDFDTDPATVSAAFGSAWFCAYAVMQIPVGLLFDFAGPHRILALSAGLCALGAVIFAGAESISFACLGRVMTGIGCGGGFLGILVACASFPPVHMGWMLGLSSVTGFGLGAFGAAAPFKVLVGRMGWRAATMVSAALPAAVCVVILPAACRCRYKKKEEEGKAPVQQSLLAQLRFAASQRNVWLWGLLGGGLDAQSNVVFGLLGYSLLKDVDGWPAPRAALAMSLIAVPVGLANFGGSAICSKLRTTNARCVLLVCLALVGLCGLALLALVNELEVAAWAGLAMVAVSIGGEGTLWVMVAEGIADEEGAGGALGGLVNTLIVLVDALAQPVCAYIVGKRGKKLASQAASHAVEISAELGRAVAIPVPKAGRYEASDFRAGLFPLVLLYVLVIACAWAVRDARIGDGRREYD